MSESVKNLEKLNKLKSLLEDQKGLGRKKYSEGLSNSRSSSKSKVRTPG